MICFVMPTMVVITLLLPCRLDPAIMLKEWTERRRRR